MEKVKYQLIDGFQWTGLEADRQKIVRNLNLSNVAVSETNELLISPDNSETPTQVPVGSWIFWSESPRELTVMSDSEFGAKYEVRNGSPNVI